MAKNVALLLVFSWLVFFVGLGLGVYVSVDLFSRLGSLMLVFAIIGEFKFLKGEQQRLYGLLEGQGNVQAGQKGIPDLTPPNWHLRLVYVAHVTTISATFVWAFGDLALEILLM